MTFKLFFNLVASDLYRYCGSKSFSDFCKCYFLYPGFKYTFWLRITRYLKNWPCLLPLYFFCRFLLHRLQRKYGIIIPYNTRIGSGFYIGHYGGIVVNPDAKIGKNCNINHGVTIGTTCGGRYPGSPTVGNNVYIGPGSFIIGGIEIGNNVAIGANTVVNKSLPDNAVITGKAGEIISFNTSSSYIINTDY